jgi:hypothetical protein
MGDNVFLRTNRLIDGSASEVHIDTFSAPAGPRSFGIDPRPPPIERRHAMTTNRTNTPTLRRQRIRTLTPNELRVTHGGSYGSLGRGHTGYPHPSASYGSYGHRGH